jgi:Mn2+/Fe2+ NRAMP family transporter
LGIHAGLGFAATVRQRYGRHAGWALAAFFLLANLGTICAEFAGIAAAASLAGIPAYVAAPAGAILVGVLVVGASFHRVEHVLLSVSAILASYLLAVVLADPDWSQAAHGLVTPVMPTDKAGIVVITATIGTTLAPWGLAFIQSYAVGKGLEPSHWRAERLEVVVGSLLTGIIGAAIAITCAAVLYPAGVKIADAHDAALALEPLAGEHASLLFGVGLLGAALLAAAIVPLATAYSMAEAFGRRSVLDESANRDRFFYGVFLVLRGGGFDPGDAADRAHLCDAGRQRDPAAADDGAADHAQPRPSGRGGAQHGRARRGRRGDRAGRRACGAPRARRLELQLIDAGVDCHA